MIHTVGFNSSMLKMPIPDIRVGQRVKATGNNFMTYKVQEVRGHRALIRCDEPGFYDMQYSVPVQILRDAEDA